MGSILFLGSWNSPFPNIGFFKLGDWTNGTPGTWYGHFCGGFWLISKTFLQMLVQIWVRWTFPRLRIDQLMNLCWKVLTPLALILVVLSSFFIL
jgi:NADH-quinone oxidoreductase subunit H